MTIADKFQEAMVRLKSADLDKYAEMLQEAYLYGSTSSEIYFKISGILNVVIKDEKVSDEVLLAFLVRLKDKLDQLIY